MSCDLCPKTFTDRSSLYRHKKTHAGVKFNCPQCDKSFSQNGNLKTHSLIHTGGKQQFCDLCPKTFTDRSSLYHHKKTHAGVKFNWPQCDKSFSLKHHLKTHSLIHTQEKPKIYLATCVLRYLRRGIAFSVTSRPIMGSSTIAHSVTRLLVGMIYWRLTPSFTMEKNRTSAHSATIHATSLLTS